MAKHIDPAAADCGGGFPRFDYMIKGPKTTFQQACQAIIDEALLELTDPDDSEVVDHFFLHLLARWKDEKDHEDINDYKAELQKYWPCTIDRMTKRPFGFHYKAEVHCGPIVWRIVVKVFMRRNRIIVQTQAA